MMLVFAVICLAVSASGAQDFVCNFDSGNCGFVQRIDDKFDWTRQFGLTPSWYTGPFTDSSGGGDYMYTEASYPRLPGDNAKMETNQAYSFDGGNKCLRFHYYMYGADMGKLKVYVGSKVVFEDYGDLGEYWYTADFHVPVYQGLHKITFEGIIGSGYRSDIAIDEIVLEDCSGGANTPPPPPTTTQVPTPPPPTDAPATPPPPPVPSTSVPGTPPPPPGSCGIRPTTRIVGGAAATHGDWPWQAMLRYASTGTQFCGGALVAPQWVVSASHCVSGQTAAKVHIRMGAHKRTSTVGTEQDFKVTKIIMHQSYQSPKSYSHDIALLKLDKPAMLNTYTNLVCLPEFVSDAAPGSKCWITGWGTLSSQGSQPEILQQASVPIVDQTTCKNSYPNEIDGTMICAGLQQGGIDACQGDSGGPMVCENGGRFYLHGATSWGYGCAAPDKYGVYARVKYLHSWIKTQMANN